MRELKIMGKDAALHEKAVQQAGNHQPPKRARKKPVRKNGKVTTQGRHPEVWAEALRLAGGDPRRLEPEAFDVVVVHNSPNWKKLKRK